MNIELQACGLIALIVLLLLITREKALDLSSRKLFVRTLIACITCLAMDILSIVCIKSAVDGSISRTAALIVCKAYLIFLIYQGYAGFLYTAAEFFSEKTNKNLRLAYRIIFIADAICILILPIDYFYADRVVYSHGPSTIAAYFFALIILVSTIAMAFTGKDATSKRRHRCILIWQGLLLAAAVIQYFFPHLLLVSFAAAFGMILVYAELENPHEGVDRLTGLFTSDALNVYLFDLYQHEQKFSVIHILLEYSAGNADLELEKRAIRHIANILNEGHRSNAFRISDNEFTLIYRNAADMEKDYSRISDTLQKFSNGQAIFRYVLIPDSTVLKSMDEFLQFQHYYENLKNQTGCIIAGEKEADEMREYLKIRDQISWALTNNKIKVYYQPIYDLYTKRFSSAEALVRIQDSEGNIVMPGKFIPIAEENGLIVPLGIEVFRQVCCFLSTHKPQQLGLDYIEVNLSMAQFDKDNPSSYISEILNEYNIDPNWINLEITETADAATRQTVLNNMNSLLAKGIRFSLDDFGTGRSNLDYFVAMPVNIVKFDYKFTHWYFENEKAKKVIEGTVNIIRSMGLPIVAEGIETKEQLDAMSNLGVTYIQGFYFSRPIPPEDYLVFLNEHNGA